MAASVFLIAASLLAAVRLRNLYTEGQEIRRYVGGPFASQLLYLQACSEGVAAGGGTESGLEGQIELCRRRADKRAGYYVYDFNIGRSAPLSEGDMETWKEYEIFRFPQALDRSFANSAANPFNRIVPFEQFSGFAYDCRASADSAELRCSHAQAICSAGGGLIACSVFDPRTGELETHTVERIPGLDLLLPQGFISGPDLYKLLKPRFFPSLGSRPAGTGAPALPSLDIGAAVPIVPGKGQRFVLDAAVGV